MLDVNKKDKIPEAYPVPSQTCKMDRFGKIAEGEKKRRLRHLLPFSFFNSLISSCRKKES